MKKGTIAICVASALLVAGAGANYHIKSKFADEYQAQRDVAIKKINERKLIELKVLSSSFNGNGVNELLSLTALQSNGKASEPLVINHKVNFSLSGQTATGRMAIDAESGLAKTLLDNYGVSLSSDGEWTYDHSTKTSDYTFVVNPSEFVKNGESFDIDDITLKGTMSEKTQFASFEVSNIELKAKDEGFSIDRMAFDAIGYGPTEPLSFSGGSNFNIEGISFKAGDQGLTIAEIKTKADIGETDNIVSVDEVFEVNGISQLNKDGSATDHGSITLKMQLDNLNKEGLVGLLEAEPTDNELLAKSLDKLSLNGPVFKLNELSSKYVNAKGMVTIKPVKVSQAYYPSSLLPFVHAELYLNANQAALGEVGAINHAELAVMQGFATRNEGVYTSDISFTNGKVTVNGKELPAL